MITGALLDCGADRDTVVSAMRAVVAEPTTEIVTRAGIRAVHVQTHATPAHRSLDVVLQRIDEAAPHIPSEALAMAHRVFARINAAEEKIHGAHVHFHEVGADDAIADVIGACTALYSLNIDGVLVRPVATGSGTVVSAHGVMPVPAPATAAILAESGLATMESPFDGELCTPTGAALLAEFSVTLPVSRNEIGAHAILATGYGAGCRDPKDSANVLRVMLVKTGEVNMAGESEEGTVDILETNVDDVSGEVIAAALSTFMAAGARDACAVPVMMKKGRPGYLVRVICLTKTSADIARCMARELGTLGVRCIPAVHRFVADRKMVDVCIEIAGSRRTVPVKFGLENGTVYTFKAEFDAAKEIADELGVPVRDVLTAADDAAAKLASKQSGKTGNQGDGNGGVP